MTIPTGSCPRPDTIFLTELDQAVANMGIWVLRTPARAPKANSLYERHGGSRGRECLDFLIPFNERHLNIIRKQ